MTIRAVSQNLLPFAAIRLRAVVMALGESVRPAWWNTGFWNETSLRFLERLYPRTFFRAAVYAAGRAACEVHDRTIGRGGVYHLFRLPETLEFEVYAVPPSADEEFFTCFRSCLGDIDRMIRLLGQMCEEGDSKDTAPGPRRIGTEADLMHIGTFGRMASVYRQAFEHGMLAFPYFTVQRIGVIE